MFRSKKIY